MYKKRRKFSNNNPRFDFKENDEVSSSRENDKKYSRSMILIKSSVFALFIILVTLIAAYLIVRNKSQDKNISDNSSCEKYKNIEISQEIDKIINSGSSIVALTESESGMQQIIRIDQRCLDKNGIINFKITKK